MTTYANSIHPHRYFTFIRTHTSTYTCLCVCHSLSLTLSLPICLCVSVCVCALSVWLPRQPSHGLRLKSLNQASAWHHGDDDNPRACLHRAACRQETFFRPIVSMCMRMCTYYMYACVCVHVCMCAYVLILLFRSFSSPSLSPGTPPCASSLMHDPSGAVPRSREERAQTTTMSRVRLPTR